jgi:hypothetical protein
MELPLQSTKPEGRNVKIKVDELSLPVQLFSI